jgi:hypothetical protein
MANEWVFSNGKACYDSNVAGFSLVQEGVLEVGKLYSVVVTVTDLTKGKISFPFFEGFHEVSENGTFQFVEKALFEDLFIQPLSNVFGVFDGCLEIVEVLEVPFYSIVDCEENEVFVLSDNTGVTVANGYVQYQIDWTDIAEGIYYIKFTSQGLDYITNCFYVKLSHDCTKQITWNNNEDAYGFNYSDLNFTQSLRINAKLWQPRYKALEKQTYEYSNGDIEINYVSKAKEILFTTEELPEYIHDALQLAVDSDNFFIDNVKYVFVEEEYSPSWRKSSSLASVELPLRISQNLRNVNCG